VDIKVDNKKSNDLGKEKSKKCVLCVPNEDFYAPQTKILEGGSKDDMRIFEARFKVVSTLFGLLIVENSLEYPHFIFCSSFQNLRLGSIILEGGTKDEMRMFEALFNGSFAQLSTHALEKCFGNPHFIF
jgi:hypothetical protein